MDYESEPYGKLEVSFEAKDGGIVLSHSVTWIHFSCPSCKRRLQSNIKEGGTNTSCHYCKQELTIPTKGDVKHQRKTIKEQKHQLKQDERQDKQDERQRKMQERKEQAEFLAKQQEQRIANAARERNEERQRELELERKKKHELGKNEFQKTVGWEQFWYVLAGLNFSIGICAIGIVLDSTTGSAVPAALIIPSIAGGIAALFFGWVSGVLNHMRWLQSEQLKELQRHHKHVETTKAGSDN